jgi:mRNA guanylyltransferase
MAKISISEPGLKAPPHVVKQLREEVAQLLGRGPTTFPGAQPVSFARRHIEELMRQEYVLSIP